MPFYNQHLSLFNCWPFSKATNIQRTLQDGEWKSTKIWQHSPLTGSREKLSVKGSCHGDSKLCCDTPWKRRKLKHRSVLNYQKLWEKTNKYSNSVNISDFQKCCPLIIFFPFCWISGSYPSPKCIIWVIYSWLLCFCELPCYQVLAQMLSRNAFQNNFKLLKEAQS